MKQILLLFFMICSFSTSAQTSASTTKTVFKYLVHDAFLKKKPQKNSELIAYIPANSKIQIIDTTSFPMYKVGYKEHMGYLHRNLVIDIPSNSADPTTNQNTSSKRNRTRTAQKTQIRQNKVKHKSYSSPTSRTKKYQHKKSSYRVYHSGPRGGCYYINKNGNKTYVSRSICH